MTPAQTTTPDDVSGNLRQMIAVLEQERQALASLDTDALTCSTREKEALCNALIAFGPNDLTSEARSLAKTARQLNEVNRRVRNLLAANVAMRLEAMGGKPATYLPPQAATA